MAESTPPPQAPLRALLQSVAVAAILLVALELGARLWTAAEPEGPAPTVSAPGAAMGQTLPGNPHLLWELAPGTWPVEGGTARVNALGMRDGERGPRQRPRALVVGDSSIFGFGVDQDELFTTLLEAELQADVVNAGVPGWSSVQALNMLHLRGLSLDPDLLIVATLWSDNNFDAFVDEEVIAEVRTSGALRSLLERSALFRAIDPLAARVTGRSSRTIATIATEAPDAGRRRVPLQRYAENLEAMARLMHERGGGVAFVTLANRMDIQRRPGDPLVWQPYRDAMRLVAERWGAPLVVLPDVFPRQGGLSLLMDEIHPNPRGHAVMARALQVALAEAGWPDQAPLRQEPPRDPLPQLDDPYEGQGVSLGLVEPDRGRGGHQPPAPGARPLGAPPPPGGRPR